MMDRGARQDERARSSQDNHSDATAVSPVSSESPSTTSHVNAIPKVGLSIHAAPGHGPMPPSPRVSVMTVSEYEIELDPLPLPPAGAWSTDKLIPTHGENQLDKANVVQLASSWTPPITTPLRPNYKPIPLRWAYQVLLLILIAGFFVFLEYETRLLPEPKFHAFIPHPLRVSSQSGQHIQPRSWPKGRWAEETQSRAGTTKPTRTTKWERSGPITATPARAIYARDPIPPESDYPKPEDGGRYCFWYPPQWRFQNLLNYYPMAEYIQFFEVSEDNKDVPLCPCHDVIYTVNGEERVRLGSADEYCDAVINAIKTLSVMEDRQFSYWQGGYPYATSFSWWRGPDRYWKTPPQLTRPPPWIYPSFAPNGDIFLPLEKRTTAPGPNGEAVSDVFGRKLEAPYIGYFPAGHTGVETMWTYLGFQMWATDTITHPETRSVLWWQLPLTRPDSALFIDDTSTSLIVSPTSVDPGIITTDTSTSSSTSPPSSRSSLESSTTTEVVSESSISPSNAPPSSASPSSTPVTSSSNTWPSGASPSTASSSSTPVTSPSRKPLESFISTDIKTIISPITSSEQSHASQRPSVSVSQPHSTALVAIPVTTGGATETSTTWTRLKTGDVLWWKTTTITTTSLSTTGSSTITDIKTISANGTTGLATITKAVIPLVSTTVIVSTSTPRTTMRFLDFVSQNPWVRPSPWGSVQLGTRLQDLPAEVTIKTYFDSDGNPTWTFAGAWRTMETVVTYPSSTVTETQTYLDGTYGFKPSPPKDDPNKWTQPKDKPSQSDRNNFFSLKSEKDFLMASLIPVLLATILAIPLQIFIKTFNHMIPFRALRYKQRSEGAEANDSLCLARGGISVFTAPKIGLWFIRKYRDPLPLLSFLLDVFTTLLIPLSSETIQIEFGKNRCASLDSPVVKYGYRGPCAIGLRKSAIPSRAAEVFMSVMCFIILVMGYLLRRWRTGVSADPWSVASMTALLSGSSREVKNLMLGITPPEVQQRSSSAPSGGTRDSNDAEVEAATSKEIAKALEGKRFRLGYFQVSSGYDRYGSAQWRHDGKDGRWGGSIRSDTTWGQTGPYQYMSYGLELVSPGEVETGSVRLTVKEPPTRASSEDKTTKQHPDSYRRRLVKKGKSLGLTLWIPRKKANTSTGSKKRRQTTSVIPTVFLVLIAGLLILILYYENTILDTPFERFMDSQTYGVRFMFTAMGTGITAFWDWYFAYICEKQHFSQLHAAASKPGHGNSSKSQQRPTARAAAPASPPSCTCVRVNITTSTILNAIPSNELAALYHAFFPSRLKFQAACQCAARNKYNTKRIDLTLAAVSLAAFLAKFAPILLSGVPFRNTITWKMHEMYTWSLVAVLGYMVLVLGILLFPSQMLRRIGSRGGGESDKTRPPPPPTSIAGYMYYVCDSVMLRDFEGLSTSSRKVRDKAVMDMAARHHEGHLESRGGRRYAFGTMTGVSGVRRVGIDYADTR
ncbi:hypothetical protein V8F33_003538 [Rhypophila sp. PSN 637]